MSEGWEPLCKFIGKDVPNEPFPNVNDAKSFQKLLRTFRVLGGVMLVAGASLVVGITYVGVKVLPSVLPGIAVNM